MVLNSDIYDDLALDIIQLIYDNPNIITRFILAGKENLVFLKRLIIKFNSRSISYCLDENFNRDPLSFLYLRTFDWVSSVLDICSII